MSLLSKLDQDKGLFETPTQSKASHQRPNHRQPSGDLNAGKKIPTGKKIFAAKSVLKYFLLQVFVHTRNREKSCLAGAGYHESYTAYITLAFLSFRRSHMLLMIFLIRASCASVPFSFGCFKPRFRFFFMTEFCFA